VSSGGAPSLRARAWRRWLTGTGMTPAEAGRLLPAVVAAERQVPPGGAAAGPPAARALRACRGRTSRASIDERVAALEAVAEAATDGAAAALAAAARTVGRWPRVDAASHATSVMIEAAAGGAWGDPSLPPEAWLAAFVAARRRAVAARHDALTITSAHRSKGLEWDVVLVPGQARGTFPRSVDDDERRLAYVAWTRARERLHLLRSADRPPSPFLTEADVSGLQALQSDLAWIAAGRGEGTLAATWAAREAAERLGVGADAPRTPGHPPLVAPEGRR
jgi:hypothetical protein